MSRRDDYFRASIVLNWVCFEESNGLVEQVLCNDGC